jgi:hypothetical protein
LKYGNRSGLDVGIGTCTFSGGMKITDTIKTAAKTTAVKPKLGAMAFWLKP